MDDAKKFEPVKLIAVERGFMNGAMVERGTKFTFTPTRLGKDGKPRLPKWAQPAEKPLPVKPSVADLKPKAAQAAVKAKAGALADNSPPGSPNDLV
jgi:hypothetical protein